ncbi:MAG: site-specific integrase [Gemmatimonadota bacterium]
MFSELLVRFEEVKLPGLAPNTRKTYTHSLAAFRAYFVNEGMDPKAHEVRPGHIQGFLHWRRMRNSDGGKRMAPLRAPTLAKDRAVLHAVFRFGETLEVVQGSPVGTVKPPKGDSRELLILKAEQYEALIGACEGRPMLRAFVLVLGESGIRCESEALWLR